MVTTVHKPWFLYAARTSSRATPLGQGANKDGCFRGLGLGHLYGICEHLSPVMSCSSVKPGSHMPADLPGTAWDNAAGIGEHLSPTHYLFQALTAS